MTKAFQDILTQLEPLKNKVVLWPLNEAEVIAIEEKLKKSLPPYYKEFLMVIGLRQDLVFETIGREDDIFLINSFLPKKVQKNYIPFADTGNGDTWLLNANDFSDTKVYEWYHETPKIITPLAFDFFELINNNIVELKGRLSKLPDNDNKNWCVQFSIKTNNEDLLLSTLEAQKLSGWIFTGTSNAGVSTYLINIQINLVDFELRHRNIRGGKAQFII